MTRRRSRGHKSSPVGAHAKAWTPNGGAPAGGKGRQGRRSRRGGRGGGKHGAEPLLEQPVAETALTVPCRICGFPVDPKRLHFHMVRFHGAALRPPPP